MASTSISTASPNSAGRRAGAVGRQHERRSQGFTGSEVDVIDAFEEIFTSTAGKIVVAMFASSIYRMQILVDLAAQFGRKVAFVGRGVIENSEIAQRLGYLRMPPASQIRDSDVRNFPAQDVVCICTGSQGEPRAALPRIAIDDHRHVKLDPDDVVVFSARAIPGNEKAIGRVMNHIARRGADVIYEGYKHVHVSGHGSEEELKLMLSLVRPKLLRADTWGVPAARPACPDRGPGVPVHEGPAGRKRRRRCGSTTGARGWPERSRQAAS